MSDDDWVDVDETLRGARAPDSSPATMASGQSEAQTLISATGKTADEMVKQERQEEADEVDGEALALQVERNSLEPRLLDCFRASHPTHAAALTAFAMTAFSLDLVRELVGSSSAGKGKDKVGEGEEEAMTPAARLANAVLPVVLGEAASGETAGKRDKGKEKVVEDAAEETTGAEDRDMEILMQVLAGENFGHIVNPFADRSGGSLEAVLWAASTALDDADFARRLQAEEYTSDAFVRDRARSIRRHAKPAPARPAATTMPARETVRQNWKQPLAPPTGEVVQEIDTDDKFVDASASPKSCDADHLCELGMKLCCHCADKRATSISYLRYVDGKGDVGGSSRVLHYCQTCRSDPHRERPAPWHRASGDAGASRSTPSLTRCRICNVASGMLRCPTGRRRMSSLRYMHPEQICPEHGLCIRCCADSFATLNLGQHAKCGNLYLYEQVLAEQEVRLNRQLRKTAGDLLEDELAAEREVERQARWEAANVPRVRTLDENSVPPISTHAGTGGDVDSDSDDDGVLLISMVEPAMLEETPDSSVLVWGSGVDGQLGLGKPSECPAAMPLPAFTPDDIVQVDAGRHASFAVDARGRLFCWGGAGLPSNLMTRRPRQIPSEHFLTQVACGDRWNAVLTAEGQVLTWSGSSSGGDATPTWVRELASVVIAQIASGGAHMLALDETGRVHAWGDGADGQLGLGQNNLCMIGTPTVVPSFNASSTRRTAVQVAAGGEHSLVLNALGDVFSFGKAADNRLGRSHAVTYCLPRKVAGLGGARIVHVACGRAHSLAFDAEGTVYAWGANENGQLGLGHTAMVKLPSRVDLMSPVQAIAAGAGASLAVMENGEVFAWGRHAVPANAAAIVQTVPMLVPNETGKSCRLAAVGEKHALATSLPISPLAMDVVQLLGNDLLSDVRVECLPSGDADEPRVWSGHRVLLARVPGLAKVLETRVHTVRFDAGTEDAVEALLTFVYGDDLGRWEGTGMDELQVATIDADGAAVGRGSVSPADVRRSRGLHEYLAKMAKAARYPTAFASDMCIVSGDGVRFAVHRAVLAVRSSVFHAMMTSGMAEGSAGSGGDMHVDEPADAVDAVLQFIYTNQPSLSQETIMEVMALAHRWSLGSLLQAWQHFVVPLVDADNAVQLLVLADVYGAHAVRTAALAAIRSNRDAVAASRVLETDLVPPHLVSVVQGCITVRDKRVRPSARAARRAHELLLDDDVAFDMSDSEENDDDDWAEEAAAGAARRRSTAEEAAADEDEDEDEDEVYDGEPDDDEYYGGRQTLAEKIHAATSWIRPARERRGMSLAVLAQRAAVNPTLLRRVEAEKTMPPADVTARLRKVLHGK